MFCPQCGSQSPDNAGFCMKCGYKIADAAAFAAAAGTAAAGSVPAPVPAPGPSLAAQPQYKGVGGWLLLFCIGATILSPLIIAVRTIALWADTATLDILPAYRTIVLATTIANVVIVAAALNAGIALWRVRPGALTAVKWFFLVLGLAILALYPVVFALQLEPTVMAGAITGQTIDAVRAGIFILIWWLYFKKSKRVLATYGRNL